MNRQSSRRSILHILLSTLTRKVPEQAKQHIQLPPRLAPDDRDAWHVYWKEQGQPWRTEPEIDLKRQAELARRRAIVPDVEKGIDPFKGMQLSRADVEWLLATHDNGRGPVDWRDEQQRQREGLNLRGADLMAVDLHGLPLSCLQGGLTEDERRMTTEEQRADIVVNLRRANLDRARLEGANLKAAQLEGASLRYAQLEGALLRETKLEGAVLASARLEGADLREAQLEGTYLSNIILGDRRGIGPPIVDVRWGTTNLAVVDWSQVKILGDERSARQTKEVSHYRRAVRANRQLAIVLQDQGLNEDAARFAYRAQVLQKTVFRLRMLQPSISLRQRLRSLGSWLFSWFLFLLAGYGYKLGRSFLAYLLVISTFMALYLVLDPHLVWYEAIVVSMAAFHGRGFSPSTFSPGDPVSIASAIEAFVGLIIEVTFIATLTRRFFWQ